MFLITICPLSVVANFSRFFFHHISMFMFKIWPQETNLKAIPSVLLFVKFILNWPCSTEKDFKTLHDILILSEFSAFEGGLFIWTNIKAFRHQSFCIKFGWNWFSRRWLKCKKKKLKSLQHKWQWQLQRDNRKRTTRVTYFSMQILIHGHL